MSATFQYLAQIASNFEEYYIHGLVFEFVSTTSPYFSGGAMGSVIFAVQYDAALPAFTSKPQMENSDFAISARPDVSIMYGVECKDQPMNGRYVRTTAPNALQPVNFTDLGTLYVANQTSIAAGTILGELWVSYDIEFRKPHISPSRFGYAHWKNSGTSGTAPANTFTEVNVLASIVGATVSVSAGAITLTFPNANLGDIYNIDFFCSMPSSTAFSPAGTPTLSGLTLLSPNTGSTVSSAIGWFSTALLGRYTGYLSVTNISSPPTFTITVTWTTSSAYNMDLYVVNIGNGISTLL
jgi:hypothetical protein